jgi:hypothetical protein
MLHRSARRTTIENVQHYFSKIGPGNSLAPALLEEQRLGDPVLAGFFRSVRLPEIRDHNRDQRPRFSYQAIDLHRWAQGELPGYAVNLAQGIFRIMEPTGAMYEMERDLFQKTVGPTPNTDDVPKLVPVRIIHEERITHIPTVLSQINASRRLSSSTFKEITGDFGISLAIDYLLFKGGILEQYPRSTPETRTMEHLLQCLGSNELITLIARLLQEHGLYVPAPNGGFVKNIDLFAFNDRPRTIDLAGLCVPGRSVFRSGAITVQVRDSSQETRPEVSPEVDYLIQLNAETSTSDSGRVLNRAWIETMLRRSPETRTYLDRVLRWVPFAGSIIRALEAPTPAAPAPADQSAPAPDPPPEQ